MAHTHTQRHTQTHIHNGAICNRQIFSIVGFHCDGNDTISCQSTDRVAPTRYGE